MCQLLPKEQQDVSRLDAAWSTSMLSLLTTDLNARNTISTVFFSPMSCLSLENPTEMISYIPIDENMF
ncbi:hypothetical protein STEG23_036599 [Scotinomys teguina]